jgi:hypothetical protein
MALVVADRVQETCNSPGTGTVSLLGAVTGYQAFSAVMANSDTCYYTIADQTGSNWEVGLGTYSSSGNTLARTTVTASSNGGALTNFSSGVQSVFITYAAATSVFSSNIATLTNKTFQAYSEKVQTVGTISTSTYNLDLSLANIFDITLGTDVTVTFTNPSASGFTRPVTLIVRQPAASPGKTLTVTGAQYTDGVTPILSTGANQKDVLSYWSIDGGTTYFGTFAMANVS